jgi:membrane protein implicated in regulation of membrane protease activity
MTLLWWHWFVLGLVLVATEMAAAGGFYVIFFGIAALVVGALDLAGLSGPVWFQLLLFSVLSIVFLLLFRSPLLRWLNLDVPARDVDSLVGELATPLEDIVPGAVGRAELRGTVWTARNSASSLVRRGERCVVVRVVQLTVFIEPEGARA